jgi:hypothetical protein
MDGLAHEDVESVHEELENRKEGRRAHPVLSGYNSHAPCAGLPFILSTSPIAQLAMSKSH